MEPQTCGQGLAEHAALPVAMGALADATAEVLETHMKALDPFDPGARKELDAYTDVARRHRMIAVELKATAAQMAGYRDLPMPKHDMTAMTAPAPLTAFRDFVKQEAALLELLSTRLPKDEEMLGHMEP